MLKRPVACRDSLVRRNSWTAEDRFLAKVKRRSVSTTLAVHSFLGAARTAAGQPSTLATPQRPGGAQSPRCVAACAPPAACCTS